MVYQQWQVLSHRSRNLNCLSRQESGEALDEVIGPGTNRRADVFKLSWHIRHVQFVWVVGFTNLPERFLRKRGCPEVSRGEVAFCLLTYSTAFFLFLSFIHLSLFQRLSQSSSKRKFQSLLTPLSSKIEAAVYYCFYFDLFDSKLWKVHKGFIREWESHGIRSITNKHWGLLYEVNKFVYLKITVDGFRTLRKSTPEFRSCHFTRI